MLGVEQTTMHFSPFIHVFGYDDQKKSYHMNQDTYVYKH